MLIQIERPGNKQIDFAYGTFNGRLEAIMTPGGSYSFNYNAGKIERALSYPDNISNTRTYSGTQVTSDLVWDGSVQTQVDFTYNAEFQVASSTVRDSGGANISAASFSYDNDGLLTGAGDETLIRDASTGFLSGTTLDQVTDTFSYDPTYGELSSYSAEVVPTSTPLLSQSFTRDALGRITEKVESIQGGTSHTFGYTYDSAGRLSAVTKDGSPYSSSTFDSNSNRTSGTVGGTAFTATYDDQDRLLTYGTKSFIYNAAGERIQLEDSSLPVGVRKTLYNYDVFGNLSWTKLPSGATFSYKFDGFNRVQMKLAGTTIQERYLYEDQYRIAAVLDGSGALLERFVYGSKPNVPDYLIKNGVAYKILSDPNGSVRLVVKAFDGTVAQKIDYDEYGKILSDTNPGFQPFAFAGCLYDQDTKLCRFGIRSYDPSVGRWISKDPILFSGADVNLYGYVLADPVNWIDPSGLLFEKILAGALSPEQQLIAGVVVAAIGANIVHASLPGVVTIPGALTAALGGALIYEGGLNSKEGFNRALEPLRQDQIDAILNRGLDTSFACK